MLLKTKASGLKPIDVELAPLDADKHEADQRYAHELGMLFQRLKTLPEALNELVCWRCSDDYCEPGHTVAAVLRSWLAPRCPVCHGVKSEWL